MSVLKVGDAPEYTLLIFPSGLITTFVGNAVIEYAEVTVSLSVWYN